MKQKIIELEREISLPVLKIKEGIETPDKNIYFTIVRDDKNKLVLLPCNKRGFLK